MEQVISSLEQQQKLEQHALNDLEPDVRDTRIVAHLQEMRIGNNEDEDNCTVIEEMVKRELAADGIDRLT